MQELQTVENKIELPVLGLHENLTNKEYHKSPGISKSGLDLIRRSPAYYQFIKANPKPSGAWSVIGSAVHSLILEPDNFENEYIKEPVVNKRTKEGKAFYQAFLAQIEEKELTPISVKSDPDKGVWGASDWQKIHDMRDAVMSHPIASVLLDSGQPEISGYWVDERVKKLCKLRMDWYSDSHNLIVDLKTTDDASYTAFSRSVDKYRYHVQDAFYCNGMRQIGKPVDEFVFVVVEKEPPHFVAVYTLDRKAKAFGKTLYERDLDRYAHCRANDIWPEYPHEVQNLELLAYAYKVDIF